jgi:hypothetical protein
MARLDFPAAIVPRYSNGTGHEQMKGTSFRHGSSKAPPSLDLQQRAWEMSSELNSLFALQIILRKEMNLRKKLPRLHLNTILKIRSLEHWERELFFQLEVQKEDYEMH